MGASTLNTYLINKNTRISDDWPVAKNSFQSYWQNRFAQDMVPVEVMPAALSQEILEGRDTQGLSALPNVDSVTVTENKIKVIRDDGLDVFLDKSYTMDQGDPLYHLTTALNKYKLEEDDPANIARAIGLVRSYGISRSQRDKYKGIAAKLESEGKSPEKMQNAAMSLDDDMRSLVMSLPAGMNPEKLISG